MNRSLSSRIACVLALTAPVTVAPALAAQPLGCLIEPQQVAEVGSPVIGVIQEMLVERGDRVAKGELIARLRADIEQAAVGVAKLRAQVEADEQAAHASFAFSRQKLERARDLLRQNFISRQALDQTQAEHDMAEQKLAQAREQKRIAAQELDLAAAQLAQRSIRSPFDGVIAERYLSVGERVEDKPLVRVARIDPLRVQVVVPAAFYGKVRAGAAARVQPQLPDAEPLGARVTLVDKLIDAPSNTFRVQLELANPKHEIPAGVRCQADLGFEPPTGAAAGGPGGKPVQPAALKLGDTPGVPPVRNY